MVLLSLTSASYFLSTAFSEILFQDSSSYFNPHENTLTYYEPTRKIFRNYNPAQSKSYESSFDKYFNNILRGKLSGKYDRNSWWKREPAPRTDFALDLGLYL